MALSDEKIRECQQRLLVSRMRILTTHGFFGLLLMHMRYAIDEKVPTACTDGSKIIFGVEFLENLSDAELDFVMMHEIMHVVLQHCFRGQDYDNYIFNIACDVVVNSNILLENNMCLKSITLEKYGESMHLAPDGKEGHEYTAEQVYNMLLSSGKQKKKGGGNNSGNGQRGGSQNGSGGQSGNSPSGGGQSEPGQWDDHSRWGKAEKADVLRDAWVKHVKDAAQAIEIRNASNSRGTVPMFAKRLLGELSKPQTDWRTILNEFVQEEVVDYSFAPPDRRFDGGDFFLPDFNEKDDIVEDVLFMVDTSGSMSDTMITAAFSEILGAIEQFNGKLRGWLGFFDAVVVEPEPFTTEEEFRIIRPEGGGGTSFDVIFDYVRDKMEQPPVSIIILTDGYAPFPDEEVSMGIPTLWLINNTEVTPPWGKIARIQV